MVLFGLVELGASHGIKCSCAPVYGRGPNEPGAFMSPSEN